VDGVTKLSGTPPLRTPGSKQALAPKVFEWAERFFNVQRWTEMPRGGHFAAMEEPGLLAEDISRTWFRSFREEGGTAKDARDVLSA
jgi:pimeloyl-ACP methyl ester carboxylesterase